MSRQGRPFKEVFDEFAGSLSLAPSDVEANEALGRSLLDVFNRGYRAGYDRRAWEDAWKSGELTLTDRSLTFLQVEDARHFEFWTTDPRQDEPAELIGCATDADGITLSTDLSEVFAFWMPKSPRFSLTAYNPVTIYAAGALILASDGHTYLCLQAATGQNPITEPTYWRQVPVLSVIAEAVIDLAAGRHLISTGVFGAGNARKGDGEAALDLAAQIEFSRISRAKRQGVKQWPCLLN